MLTDAEMTLSGRAVPYTLRRSSRARWVSGWIRPETGLVITLPLNATLEQAERFLRTHQRWVTRQLDRLTKHAAELPKPWPYGDSLLFLGEPHVVEVQQGTPGQGIRTPGKIIVQAPSASIEGARRVLQRWLKAEAQAALGEQVRLWAGKMGLAPKRIYVRNLRRSWGSCWPGGSLSFSWRLIMAPPSVLDYVVIHELAHLADRSHSKAFWSLVASHYPDHKVARAWLRRYGGWLGV